MNEIIMKFIRSSVDNIFMFYLTPLRIHNLSLHTCRRPLSSIFPRTTSNAKQQEKKTNSNKKEPKKKRPKHRKESNKEKNTLALTLHGLPRDGEQQTPNTIYSYCSLCLIWINSCFRLLYYSRVFLFDADERRMREYLVPITFVTLCICCDHRHFPIRLQFESHGVN